MSLHGVPKKQQCSHVVSFAYKYLIYAPKFKTYPSTIQMHKTCKFHEYWARDLPPRGE